MSVYIIVVTAVSLFCFLFLVVYYAALKRGFRLGHREGIEEGFKRSLEGDALIFGNAYMEIRRLDPMKVRLKDIRREEMSERKGG